MIDKQSTRKQISGMFAPTASAAYAFKSFEEIGHSGLYYGLYFLHGNKCCSKSNQPQVQHRAGC